MVSHSVVVSTEIGIGGRTYLLAASEDVKQLEQRIQAAARGPAAFVEFTIVGGRRATVLINDASQVSLLTESVELDSRDAHVSEPPPGAPVDEV